MTAKPIPPARAILEICVESVAGALAAQGGGADRLELCSGLALGGLTPSAGVLGAVLAGCALPCMVLVRPRPGDFVYDAGELDAMGRDVEAARAAGASGVVLGVLRPDGAVDVGATAALVERARPLEVTFHRALDMTRDPLAALDALIDLGVERVLTSGGAASVPEGLDTVRALVERAAGRIAVMAGGGLRAADVAAVVAATGVAELHGSASDMEASPMQHENPACSLGAGRLPGEYERRLTSEERVRALARQLAAATGR